MGCIVMDTFGGMVTAAAGSGRATGKATAPFGYDPYPIQWNSNSIDASELASSGILPKEAHIINWYLTPDTNEQFDLCFTYFSRIVQRNAS